MPFIFHVNQIMHAEILANHVKILLYLHMHVLKVESILQHFHSRVMYQEQVYIRCKPEQKRSHFLIKNLNVAKVTDVLIVSTNKMLAIIH